MLYGSTVQKRRKPLLVGNKIINTSDIYMGVLLGVHEFLSTDSQKIKTLSKKHVKKLSTTAYYANNIEGPICFKPQNIYLKTYQPGVRPSCASITGYKNV